MAPCTEKDLTISICNGNSVTKSKTIGLELALELTGDGVYKHLLAFVSGINLLAGVVIALTMAYVLPATDCDMKLTSAEKGLLASVSFTGMIFSSHLFGFLSDTYGRRYVVLRCNLMSAFLSILASFAPTMTLLSIVWFANGFVISGSVSPIYVLVSEFCTLKNRTKSLLYCAAISSLVAVYLPCVGWLVIPLEFNLQLFGDFHYSSWRLYLALTAVPLLFASFLLLFIPESPKYLLSRGYKYETLHVLRTLYAKNMKKKPEEYPVEDVCLDPGDEWKNEKQGFLKTMMNQTILLFKPPLLSYMVVSCATNMGLIGAYNIIMLWLPENVSKLSAYESSQSVSDTTKLCDVILYNYDTQIKPDNVQIELLNGTSYRVNETSIYNINDTCTVAIDRDVYLVNIIIGAAQFLTFGASSKLTDITGRKPIIVIFTVLSALSSLMVNLVPINYTTICLGSIVVLVGAVVPIAISIIVDFFPTHVRGMATCICMIFGRIGASGGSQLFGILQSHYCDKSYYALTGFLIGVAVLCLMIPLKK